ncbi:MAG: arginine--tRNA ligase [Burkholderiaceae bacterium]|nr:arginine--tRNA ligase [Burkholderiaceae bacterium]
MLASQIQKIRHCFEDALREMDAPENIPVVLEKPRQSSNGDLACTIALQCAKALKKNPRQIATELVEKLSKNPAVSELIKTIDIAGPGFINMALTDNAKQEIIRTVLKEGTRFGHSEENKDKSVIIEYVSANPTGPLHLGHARQGALGDVLSNLFASQGWNVTREFYYNDAGVQIHNLAISVQYRAKELNGEAVEFPESGYHGSYIYDIAKLYLEKCSITTFDGQEIASSGDLDDLEAIRRYAVAFLRNEQNSDLKALGVAFDNFYLESSLYSDGLVARAVDSIQKHGKTFDEGGALWFRSTDYGDDKDRVMRKADGTFTYFVPDVAYHLTKFERGFSRAIDIQGSDHHGTTARVRAGIQAAGAELGLDIPQTFPEYMLHKMVKVVMNGEEVKMSKRAGTYVTLRELVDWVGRDAARLFLVSRKCDAEFTFDVDLARSQSDENPVYYLQYAHARICSVLKQATEKGFVVPTDAECTTMDLSSLNSESEFNLMATLSKFPEILAFGAEEKAPHSLGNYLKDLAANFHSFYNAQRILIDDANVRNARLALLLATRQVLRNGLSILGVSAPERMDREETAC